MKKILFAVVAVIFALGAAAQNRSIDKLAKKYADAEGFTVIDLNGETIQSIISLIPDVKFKEVSLTLDDGTTVTPADLLRNIVSLTGVVRERHGGEKDNFAAEARRALDSRGYSVVVSRNGSRESVKLVSSEIKRGKFRGQMEYVAVVVSGDSVILGRVIGRIDTSLLARVAEEVQK